MINKVKFIKNKNLDGNKPITTFKDLEDCLKVIDSKINLSNIQIYAIDKSIKRYARNFLILVSLQLLITIVLFASF